MPQVEFTTLPAVVEGADGDVLLVRRAGGSYETVDIANLIRYFSRASDFSAALPYPRGALVYYQGDLYRANTALAAAVWDVANWDLVSGAGAGSVVASASITAWTAVTAYATGDTVVTPMGDIVYRTGAGTSGATFDATEAGDWTLLFLGPIMTTYPGTAKYIFAGRALLADGKLWYHTASGATSGVTFTAAEAANWTPAIADEDVEAWAATTYYRVGEVVVTPGGAIVRRNATGASGATFDATEAGDWTFLSGGSPTLWAANTYYYALQFVVELGGNQLLFCGGGFTSQATFNATEAANWFRAGHFTIGTWAPATAYTAGHMVVYQGALMQRYSAGVSAGTFDAGESALWQRLSGVTRQVLVDAAPIASDLGLGRHMAVTMGAASRTISFPINPVIGSHAVLELTASGQDTTVTFSAGYEDMHGNTLSPIIVLDGTTRMLHFYTKSATELVTGDAHADYAVAERPTGRFWIDGQPIYRQVLTLTGGNGSSTATLTGAVFLMPTSVYRALNGAAQEINLAAGSAQGMSLTGTTLTVSHAGIDYTAATAIAIVEYTKA